ncbi:MAG: hypothetical protein JNM43_06995 [Planctomycetaceae bacterium]|nr:hypothetical protein [Planctomycetaceae bacterium]
MRSFILAVAVLTLGSVASVEAGTGATSSLSPALTTHNADVMSGRVHLRTRSVGFFHRATPVRTVQTRSISR